jgi:hypothetical protein
MQVKKSKRGVSEMIGYILLVTLMLVIGVIVYQWAKTYIPRDSLSCPGDVSVSISSYSCTNFSDGKFKLNATLKNNGKFGFAGYFIHATTNESQEVATLDLSQYLVGSSGVKFGNSILIYPSIQNDNPFNPGDMMTYTFNFSDNIKKIEVIPTRFQPEGNIMRYVSCGDSKIEQEIICT